MKERQAAKALRKLQLAELRATAGSRATGEERRKVERDREAEGRIRWEREELERMRAAEAAQLAGGDRFGRPITAVDQGSLLSASRFVLRIVMSKFACFCGFTLHVLLWPCFGRYSAYRMSLPHHIPYARSSPQGWITVGANNGS